MVASLLFFIGAIKIYSKSKVQVFQAMLTAVFLVGVTVVYIIPEFMEASIETRAENETAIERSLSLFDYDKVSHARTGAFDRFVIYVQEIPFGAGFSRVGAAAGAFKELHQEDRVFGYKYFF